MLNGEPSLLLLGAGICQGQATKQSNHDDGLHKLLSHFFVGHVTILDTF